MTLRVLYTDVDGTLVGPRGSFFRAPDGSRLGALTLEPARALLALHEAEVALVLVSGRTRPQLVEASLLLGASGFIAELGGVVGWPVPGGLQVEHLPASGPPAAAELVADLVTAFDLRLYEPWHEGHEVDVLMRGTAEPAAVQAWLAEREAGHLRLRDNGRSHHGDTIFHLLPDGVGKAEAVAWDLTRREIDPADAVAVGDSAEDLAMAASVGRFWLVANGLGAAGGEPAALPPNASVTAAPMGLGWAEAVTAELREPRPL